MRTLRSWRLAAVGVAVSLTIWVTSTAVAKEPIFTTIDVPGADITTVSAVNAQGDIVGMYYSYGSATGKVGFLLSNGVFTNIYIGRDTIPMGINTQGEIVGVYEGATPPRGFFLSRRVFVYINAPSNGDTPGATQALGINPQGDIVGLWSFNAMVHGYLLMKGAFISIDAPGASYTAAFGINPAGDIVGYYSDSSWRQHGFLLSHGKFSIIDFPGAAYSTEALGINPAGQIVGTYQNSMDEPVHGFLLSDGTFTTIDVPGASRTELRGITPQGDIVGTYSVDSAVHGFLLRR